MLSKYISNRDKNNISSKRWYNKQKNNGIIFLITFPTEDTYVGYTTNSLQKRLHQFFSDNNKLSSFVKSFKKEQVDIIPLQYITDQSKVKEVKQYWIDVISPTLNKQLKQHKQEGLKKRRNIVYKNKTYVTKVALWRAVGKVPLNTFKARLRRTGDLEYALGDKNN